MAVRTRREIRQLWQKPLQKVREKMVTMQAACSVAGDAIDKAKTLTANRYEVSVIKNTFYHGEKTFCITAVRRQQTDQGVVNCLKDYILRYLYGIIVFFVVLTLLVNGITSWWLSRSILKPLRSLSMGTKEIREGAGYRFRIN